MKTISLERACQLRKQYVESQKSWEAETEKLRGLLKKDAVRYHANRKAAIKHAETMVKRYADKITELDECVCVHENAGRVAE